MTVTTRGPRLHLRLRPGRALRHPRGEEPRVIALSPAELNRPAPLVLTRRVADEIELTVGARPAESGGVLGGTRGSGVVRAFHDDTTAALSGVTYYPDIAAVNRLLREDWNPAGVNLLGFVHSHPAGSRRPSWNDLHYAERILAGIPELDRLVLPIVQTTTDAGRYTIRGYAATRRGHDVHLVDLQTHVVQPVGDRDPADLPQMQRVATAYDLQAMASARIVSVGCGGSASFLEDIARAGVGEFVLIDPDVVESSNIGTQHSYLTDLGVAKVDAVARRIVAVNPYARVWVVRALLDELTDDAMRRLSKGWLPGSRVEQPTASLLAGFTDNFAAQARTSRLGLTLGVPYLGATVYQEGRGVEVTFAAAGVTPACTRCALRSRYLAEEAGPVPTVTSHGTPLWATTRLNALKLPIALGLLHTVSTVASPDHPGTLRHRRLIESVAERNLVQVSLDPDVDQTLGLRAFAEVAHADERGRLPVDTTLWLRQLPDNPGNGYPECPDCGGTGDLADTEGRLLDTAAIPRQYGEGRRD